jgi:serine/threonine protein kinase
VALNGGNPDRILHKNVKLYIPEYATVCKTTTPESFQKTDGSKDSVSFPKGSYLCSNNKYSEFINGVLCGNLYRNGISINFIDVFGFATCEGAAQRREKKVYQYVFMEKISGSLEKYYNFVTKNNLTSIVVFIQILHAIAVYQKHYKLQHNDLHMDNVFLEKITPETKYKGESLHDAKFFHYKVEDIDLYLPFVGAIVKIGDFGLSVKYKPPIVGDMTAVSDGYDDGDGSWIPNWYAPNYDALYAACRLYNLSKSEIMKLCLAHMMNLKDTGPVGSTIPVYFNPKIGYRPRLDKLHELPNGNPITFLKSSLINRFWKKPDSGKIVTLGEV